MIRIQIEDGSHNWLTVSQCNDGDTDLVPFYMKDVKDRYPDKRVRAINSKGSLVDMM